MHNYNNRKNRLLISFILGTPSYAVFALIRNFPFSNITYYAFLEYGLTASVAFFVIFELQQLQSKYLNVRVPWESQTRFRLAIELVSNLLITSVVTFLAYAFLYSVIWEMKLFLPSIFLYISLVYFVSLSFIAFVNVAPLIANWKASLVKAELLEKQTAEAKLEALRVQLSPHFFFNNLSILNGLVEQHPTRAKGFIAKLSDVFRYILAHKNDELVTLTEELKFIHDYVFLLKSRFEEKIMCEIDVLNDKDFLIPPVTLQQLIENAVKHNEASYNKPLAIQLFLEGEYLVVTNTIQKIKMTVSSSGIGLENIKQRFALLTDREVLFSTENGLFTVKLPLLATNHVSKNELKMKHQ